MCIRDSGEWQLGGHLVERLDHQHLLAHPHGYALGPAAGDVGQREGVDELTCLLYTSDAADERSSVDLGGRRIIKQKKKKKNNKQTPINYNYIYSEF